MDIACDMEETVEKSHKVCLDQCGDASGFTQKTRAEMDSQKTRASPLHCLAKSSEREERSV
jgi:hypothetical protein